MTSKPYVVIVGGTGAPRLVCLIYYFILSLLLDGKTVEIPELGVGSVEKNYKKLEPIINQRCPDESRPIILLGHSQGGYLSVMYAMSECGWRVAKVVTICTAHKGTNRCRKRFPGAFGDFAKGSEFLNGAFGNPGYIARFNDYIARLGEGAIDVICNIYAVNDELVQPNPEVEGVRNIRLCGVWGHFTTIFNPAVWCQLREFIVDVSPIRQEDKMVPSPSLLEAA